MVSGLHWRRWPRKKRSLSGGDTIIDAPVSTTNGFDIKRRKNGSMLVGKEQKIETKASVSTKQAVTENRRYELINCVSSRSLSFIEIQPLGLASPNSVFIIFTFYSFSILLFLSHSFFCYEPRKDRFCFNRLEKNTVETVYHEKNKAHAYEMITKMYQTRLDVHERARDDILRRV